MKIVAAVLSILIVILGLLDIISTEMSIAVGAEEQNPIVAWVMLHLGEWWIVPKLILHVGAGILFYLVVITSKGFSLWYAVGMLILVEVVYIFVVGSNFLIAYTGFQRLYN